MVDPGAVQPPVLQVVQRQGLVAGQALGRLDRQVLDDVELPGLEAGHPGARILDQLEVDLVEEDLLAAGETVGPLVARIGLVVGEPLEPDMAVGLPFDELQRPGADQVDLAALLVALAGRQDGQRRHEAGHLVEEHRHLARQAQHHGVRVGGLDRADRRQDHLLQGDPLVTLERGLDVGRGHFLAVVELDAAAQREGVAQAVRAFGDLVGQVGHDGVVLVTRDQGLEHVHGHVAGGDRGGEIGVERGRRRFLGEHQHGGALLRQGMARRGDGAQADGAGQSPLPERWKAQGCVAVRCTRHDGSFWD